MKTYTIEISNIDYSGNDFCGEITGEEAVKIFASQPKVLLISFQATDEELEGCNDELVDEVVFDYCYDNGILSPTSFDYLFVD
jgi:hypothetical protein